MIEVLEERAMACPLPRRLASPRVSGSYQSHLVERLKPFPRGRQVALGQRLTEAGRSRIVKAAEIGAEVSRPFLIAGHPAHFLGPYGEVSALHRADVAQPQLGHVPEYFGPPAAPVLQPTTRTLDAFACGLEDGRVRRAVVDARPGHQAISVKQREPQDRHGIVRSEQGIAEIPSVVVPWGIGRVHSQEQRTVGHALSLEARGLPSRQPGWLESTTHDLRHTGNHIVAATGASLRELMGRMVSAPLGPR